MRKVCAIVYLLVCASVGAQLKILQEPNYRSQVQHYLYLANATKLSLLANTPIGARVQVVDFGDTVQTYGGGGVTSESNWTPSVGPVRINSTDYNDIPTAIGAATSGDTIQLIGGMFALGNAGITLPGGVSLSGSGKTLTVITSTKSNADAKPIVEPGVNSHVNNLEIRAGDASVFQVPFGCRDFTSTNYHPSAPTGVTVTNVKLTGVTDCFWLSTRDHPASFTFTNCDFVSQWDTIIADIQDTDENGRTSLTFTNCTITAAGPPPYPPGDGTSDGTSGPQVGFAVDSTFSGCTIQATNGAVTVFGLYAHDGAAVHLTTATSIITAGSPFGDGPWDIVNQDSTVTTDGTAVYDPAKVNGTVTGP